LEETRDFWVVMETGTHSRWVAQLPGLLEQDVVVGNSRKLKLITQNDRTSDKAARESTAAFGRRGDTGLPQSEPGRSRG